MNDDPPLLILLGAIVFFLVTFTLPTPPVGFETKPVISVNAQMGIDTENSLVILRGNTLMGMGSPSDEPSLASLTGIDELDRIIEAESSNRWWVKNPHSSAYGYCQMIRKTRLYVERKWNMKIDWQDPEQQLYACKRLYIEEGTRHWESSRAKWEK